MLLLSLLISTLSASVAAWALRVKGLGKDYNRLEIDSESYRRFSLLPDLQGMVVIYRDANGRVMGVPILPEHVTEYQSDRELGDFLLTNQPDLVMRGPRHELEITGIPYDHFTGSGTTRYLIVANSQIGDIVPFLDLVTPPPARERLRLWHMINIAGKRYSPLKSRRISDGSTTLLLFMVDDTDYEAISSGQPTAQFTLTKSNYWTPDPVKIGYERSRQIRKSLPDFLQTVVPMIAQYEETTDSNELFEQISTALGAE